MVSHFVSNSHEVMTTLSVMLPSNCCCGDFSAISLIWVIHKAALHWPSVVLCWYFNSLVTSALTEVMSKKLIWWDVYTLDNPYTVAPTNAYVCNGVLYAGVDVILDIVGAPYLNRNVEALAVGGRLFIIGLQEGATGDINLSPVLGKHLTVAGTSTHPSCLPWLQCYATFLFK